jgi:hypothetical protein
MYTFDYKDESTVSSTSSNDETAETTAETMDDERQIPPEAVVDTQEDNKLPMPTDH